MSNLRLIEPRVVVPRGPFYGPKHPLQNADANNQHIAGRHYRNYPDLGGKKKKKVQVYV
jgi:hypothetical protein